MLTIFADEVSTKVTDENRNSDNDVLAEYDGGKILRKDLNEKISKLPPQIQGRYKTVENQIQILDIMATEEVFYLEALKRQVDQEAGVLEKIDRAKKQLFVQEYYKRFVADAVYITEIKKNEYYQENLKAYFVNPYITINYIQAENEEMANKAIAELRAGTPFEQVSATYCQNTYAKGLKGKIKNIRLNGHIPGVGDDPDLDAEIAKTAADPAVVHGPFNTKTGWHIFVTIERVEGRQRPYDEVAEDIENRLRPLMEKDILDKISETLKAKYTVIVDTLLMGELDIQKQASDPEYLNRLVVSSPYPELQFTVSQVYDLYNKMPPQEQIFHVKSGGAANLMKQELQRALMYKDSQGRDFEKIMEENAEFQQMKRYHLLQETYKKLVQDAITIPASEVEDYYNSHLDAYTTPANRQIRVLWFKDEKSANRIWKRYTRAVKRIRDKDIQSLIKKYSTKPDKVILDNQYNNGIITGIGPDEEWSKRVWDLSVGAVSPVFKTAAGEVIFFQVTQENPAVTKPLVEVEPRIHGLLKKEKESSQLETVKEQLFVQFNMQKYPERVRLLLSSEELFNLADSSARQRKFNDALVFYDQIINNYKNGVDDYKAHFMKAFLVAEEMKKTDVALDLFKAFLKNYPEGDLHESARFMIQELEGGSELEFGDDAE